jgi:uncharacterized RDD family membrane protein YckC
MILKYLLASPIFRKLTGGTFMTDEPTSKPEEETPEAEATVETPLSEAVTPETEPETLPPEATPSTLGNRIIAVIIDGLIAGVCSLVPVVGFLVGLGYMITRDALPFLDGQSIGKKAMKLRAVSAETGKPLTNDWGPSVIRNIVLYIPFFSIVELIVLLNNKNGQRLGDQWAKTKVVVEG